MEENSIINSSNLFAIYGYSLLRKSNENLFILPLSIFTTLTMIYVGARTKDYHERRIKENPSSYIASEKRPSKSKGINE